MKFATNEEHAIKEILVGARVKWATLKKNQVIKLWFILETISLRSWQTKRALDPAPVYFWVTLGKWIFQDNGLLQEQYSGGNRNKLYFMTLHCDGNLIQLVSTSTPTLIFYETLFTVFLPWKISIESL